MELEEIRRKINDIDSGIIRLLSERSTLVGKAGRLKRDEQAVRDPERVRRVMNRVKREAVKNDLDPDIAEKIYEVIIDCFISKELKGFKGNNDSSSLNTIRIYSQKDLPLRPDVPGAHMWAVGLEKAMLTYFELKPDTVFPEHSHEAEQITMIFEGRLTFAYEGREVTLKEGDVIAIPSNVVHSAFTGAMPCKAVDAWSPVRKEFLR